MSRCNSFYLAPPLWREPFLLEGEEAHHALRVLRTRKGETIRLFDGQGRSGLFTVTDTTRQSCSLRLLESNQDMPAAAPLTLAVGWSKQLRRSYFLEKAVEFGASAIWFWQAAHSQGTLPDAAKEQWQRQLITAAKQCGQTFLPEIRLFPQKASLITASRNFGRRILCWEEEKKSLISPQDITHPEGSLVLLGPEGGFSSEEIPLFLDAQFTPRTLGPWVLRFESAAMMILALHLWAAAEKNPEKC